MGGSFIRKEAEKGPDTTLPGKEACERKEGDTWSLLKGWGMGNELQLQGAVGKPTISPSLYHLFRVRLSWEIVWPTDSGLSRASCKFIRILFTTMVFYPKLV